MNTITIDSNTYNSIEQYARQNHMSVTEAVVTGLNTFLESSRRKSRLRNMSTIFLLRLRLLRQDSNAHQTCRKITRMS